MSASLSKHVPTHWSISPCSPISQLERVRVSLIMDNTHIHTHPVFAKDPHQTPDLGSAISPKPKLFSSTCPPPSPLTVPPAERLEDILLPALAQRASIDSWLHVSGEDKVSCPVRPASQFGHLTGHMVKWRKSQKNMDKKADPSDDEV